MGTTINSLDHKSPRAFAENADGSLNGSVGFTVFRSADGPANLIVAGAQDLVTPTPFIIYNYGISPGSFATVTNGPAMPLGSSEGNNWSARPVIVSGTFTPGGFMKMQRDSATAGVLLSTSGIATAGATLQFVPEPATLALFGLGLIGMRTFGLRLRPIC